MNAMTERLSRLIPVAGGACRSRPGFSLVEVTIAIGIIATAVLGVIALVPFAVEASREASDETTTSLVMEDVRSQLRGTRVPIGANAKYAHGSYYYDQQGQLMHFEPATGAATFGVPAGADLKAPVPMDGSGNPIPQVVAAADASFRADVTIVPAGAYHASNVPAGGLGGSVTVILELYSPINLNNGAPLPPGAAPLRTICFPMSRLTDAGWELYEGGYQPRLEI